MVSGKWRWEGVINVIWVVVLFAVLDGILLPDPDEDRPLPSAYL